MPERSPGRLKPGGQRARRAARREAFHADRLAEATTPQQAAQIAMSQVRADIAKLPEKDRDEAWKTVTRHLVIARKQFPVKSLPTGKSPETTFVER